jgi:glyoxylase I family protein
VDNIDTAVKFYTNAFGFQSVQQENLDNDLLANRVIGMDAIRARMVMLKAPNAFVELWQYAHPEPEDRRSRPCDYGYPHMALQVENMEAELGRLRTHGMTFVGDAVCSEQASAIYGYDPFGNIIELYEIKTAALPQLSRHAL